jgi:23S rRNA (cytosine1962-C5)-methyltransferase
MFQVRGWVRLAAGEDQRLRDGHLWVYSNEVAESGGDFEDGDVVAVEDSSRRRIGTGLVNRASKIMVRLLTRGSSETFSEATLLARLRQAIARRAHLGLDVVRLVNAEGDLLPGLVVDRYGGVVVIQTRILGWERRRDAVVDAVIDAVESLVAPAAVVLKNDSISRKAEGLESYCLVARGSLEGNVVVSEGGLNLEIDVLKGQKTGFYIDQRDNRRLVLPFVGGKRVLDCFCYTGAWSLACAKAGAREVLGLDSSEPAVELARRNAERNGLAEAARFEVCDVFDRLAEVASRKDKFDVVILDPPSLARTRRAVPHAERGYVHLNRLALGLLSPSGLVATCSCSHHVSGDGFQEMLRSAAALARKQVAVLASGAQPPDHPWLLGLPETHYLKCLVLALP